MSKAASVSLVLAVACAAFAVGMSVGNFFGLMFTEAFLRDGLSERVAVAFEPVPRGGEIAWAVRF